MSRNIRAFLDLEIWAREAQRVQWYNFNLHVHCRVKKPPFSIPIRRESILHRAVNRALPASGKLEGNYQSARKSIAISLGRGPTCPTGRILRARWTDRCFDLETPLSPLLLEPWVLSFLPRRIRGHRARRIEGTVDRREDFPRNLQIAVCGTPSRIGESRRFLSRRPSN